MKSQDPVGRFRFKASEIPKLVDALLFALLCAASVRVLFRDRGTALFACALVFFGTALLLTLRSRIAREKARQKAYAETEQAIRTEKILLLSDEAISAALGETDVFVIRKTEPTADDILQAIAQRPRCIAAAADVGKFRPILAAHAPELPLFDLRERAGQLGVSCTEEEIGTRLRLLNEQNKKRIRIRLTPHGAAVRFFALGTLLLVLSLFWKHKIYYRLLSGVCFSLAVISGIFRTSGRGKYFTNFLDNIDK